MAKSTTVKPSKDEQVLQEDKTSQVPVENTVTENVDSESKTEPSNDDQPKESISHDINVSTGDDESSAHADVSTITVETSSDTSGTVPTDRHLVKIKIGYPKDYSKPKFMKDGDVKEVGQDIADKFVNSGIAKIVK